VHCHAVERTFPRMGRDGLGRGSRLGSTIDLHDVPKQAWAGAGEQGRFGFYTALAVSVWFSAIGILGFSSLAHQEGIDGQF
jgi:hypothetical protein